jgi:hypothetical protein
MSADDEARVQGLEADVDARLTDLWAMLWSNAPHPLTDAIEDDNGRTLMAGLLRHAYALGYHEALVEDSQGRRGELNTAHGYAVP